MFRTSNCTRVLALVVREQPNVAASRRHLQAAVVEQLRAPLTHIFERSTHWASVSNMTVSHWCAQACHWLLAGLKMLQGRPVLRRNVLCSLCPACTVRL